MKKELGRLIRDVEIIATGMLRFKPVVKVFKRERPRGVQLGGRGARGARGALRGAPAAEGKGEGRGKLWTVWRKVWYVLWVGGCGGVNQVKVDGRGGKPGEG